EQTLETWDIPVRAKRCRRRGFVVMFCRPQIIRGASLRRAKSEPCALLQNSTLRASMSACRVVAQASDAESFSTKSDYSIAPRPRAASQQGSLDNLSVQPTSINISPDCCR